MLITLLRLKKDGQILNHLNLKLVIDSQLQNMQKTFRKKYTGSLLKEIFVIDFVLKANLWKYKTKDLKGEKIIARFYEEELLLGKL